MCPLLQPNAAGALVCSVNAADVRPFWSRFWLFYVGVTVAVVGGAVGSVYGVMRIVGYPVTLRMIGWPPAWREIDLARSQYFLERARTAHASGDVAEAVLSLSLAYEYDSRNYEAGMLLARLWQAGRPDVANHLYRELYYTRPELRSQTAQEWLRALLPRLEFEVIENLAGDALLFDVEHRPAWIHALLFANQRTRNSDYLRQRLELEPPLPAAIAQLLELELLVRESEPDSARRFLLDIDVDGAPGFALYYRVRRLIGLGAPADALQLLLNESGRLSDRDRIALQLRAYATSNYRRSHERLFDELCQIATTPAAIDLLCAHLIAQPDEALYRRLISRISPASIASPDQRHAVLLDLFCVAGVHQDTARTTALAEELRTLTQAQYGALNRAEDLFANPSVDSLRQVLPLLQPLSLEINLAMIEHFAPLPQ